MWKAVLKAVGVRCWRWLLVFVLLIIVGIEPAWTLYQQAHLAQRNDKWIALVAQVPHISMRDARLLFNLFLYQSSDDFRVVISQVREGQMGSANAGQLIIVKQLADGRLPGGTVLGDKAAGLFNPHQDYSAIDPDNVPDLRIDRRLWPKSLTLPAGRTVWVTEVHIRRRGLTPLDRWLPLPRLPDQLFCYSFF